MTLVDSNNKEINHDVSRTHHYGARFSSLWEPTKGVEFELNVDGFKQDDGTNLSTPIVPNDPTSLAQLLSKSGTSNFHPLYGPNRGSFEPLTAQGGFRKWPGSHYDGYGVVFKASVDTGIGTFKSITGYRKYTGD